MLNAKSRPVMAAEQSETVLSFLVNLHHMYSNKTADKTHTAESKSAFMPNAKMLTKSAGMSAIKTSRIKTGMGRLHRTCGAYETISLFSIFPYPFLTSALPALMCCTINRRCGQINAHEPHSMQSIIWYSFNFSTSF